ncbi:MAG TPA: biotin--[acetyl-CoA-carboxylase] ligase [Caulobacteraceae bacterium]
MTGGATPVLRLDEIDSTNAEARRRAEAGETGPLWITALHQAAGRGRRGRAWSTGAGNLAATLLITTDKPAMEAAQAAFVAALAVSDMLADYAWPGAVSIKWPNDVLLEGRKASGVLIESGAAPHGGLWLAVGVGVNLADAPDDVERPAARLVDCMAPGIAPPTRDEALDALSSAFARRWTQWHAEGFEPVLDAWSRRAAGIPGPCEARLDAETVGGVAEGLDRDGALLVRLEDGTVRRITAGDVFFGSENASA